MAIHPHRSMLAPAVAIILWLQFGVSVITSKTVTSISGDERESPNPGALFLHD